ncbi:MAG: bifunctional diguanylate cyclase/phosphodiesterase, partial [Firmicutes bacterium]|nr:bifunctional diguanylate cyclase/phosphodiesterase [Bacillota bacterium]
ALLFVDLDGFKIVNDTFGHETGDMVLVECAQRLRQSLRASDFIARLGGDEFVILVRNVTNVKNLTTLVNKILATVRKTLDINGKAYSLSASIGIGIYPQDGQDKQSLMKAADLAMYAAKEKGNNNYQFSSMGIKTQFSERSMFAESLPRAMERNEFFLEYQPKLDLKTGAITGVEALLRWRNPSLGLVTPMRLIPAAESTGLIVPIGRWVLNTACQKNMAWQRQGLPRIGMAVNLSHRQLMDEKLLEDIIAALDESGMDPELLELEITENLLLSYFPRIIGVLNELKELGVRLALDDFGSGYSSLAQIRHLPVDTLKIDRSIVGNVPVNKIDMAVIEAIVGIGKSLDMTIVAEGVETSEQLAFLQDPFCDEVQGFYFSKPVSPEHAAELISKKQFEFLK